jgi:tRNA(Met) C34 N-acetyltransferase TmcA
MHVFLNISQTSSGLQDFEGLTPNLLARTIETVEGGGAVVILLSSLRSLRQLFCLTMDSHARLRTESHQDVRGAISRDIMGYHGIQSQLKFPKKRFPKSLYMTSAFTSRRQALRLQDFN